MFIEYYNGWGYYKVGEKSKNPKFLAAPKNVIQAIVGGLGDNMTGGKGRYRGEGGCTPPI